MRLLLVEDYLPLQRAVAKGLREAGFAVDATAMAKRASGTPPATTTMSSSWT
jgi:DNA-binding response OmpR family regulator